MTAVSAPSRPATMRAMVLTKIGGPQFLQPAELPTPNPAPGEVLIRVHTVAANRQDTFTMCGRAQKGAELRLPHVLGIDPAGVVAEFDGGVDGLQPGERVVVKPSISCGECRLCVALEDDACERLLNIGVHRQGGMAEFIAVPVRNVFRIPDSLSFAEASAMAHSFPVALTMLRNRAHLQADDVVLITSAAGAIGSAAVQLAKLDGATVIAAAGGADRAKYARSLGADQAIDYRARPDFSRVVLERFPAGVTLYVESAGDPAIWSEALKTLARQGRATVCGSHAGGLVEVDLNWLFRTRVSLIGCSGSTLASFREVLELAGSGRVRANIHTVLPLERVGDAFAILLARQNQGKVILEVAAV